MPVSFTDTDLDNAASETGVVHESVANTDHNDIDNVKQGYSIANPYLSSNLVGYWPFQEDSGTTAYDFSGNNNDGAINGATVNQTGLLGTSAYSFDGVDDYVDVPRPSVTGGVSLICWAGADDTNNLYQLIGFGQSGVSPAIFLRLNSGSADDIRFYVNSADPGDITATHTDTSTNWSQYALTASENGTVTAYINGSSVGTDSIGAFDSLGGSTDAIGSGRNAPERVHNGNIGPVWYYGTELSSADIAHNYDVVNTAGELITSSKVA